MIEKFLEFTNESTSVYKTVSLIEKKLKLNNFKKLKLNEEWKLNLNEKYYLKKNDSTIIAFTVPKDITKAFFKITANHTDNPGFKIKTNPEVVNSDNYLRINTEVYGGPILNTWFDRPLSVSGRVFLKNDNVLSPKSVLVDIKRPIMIIQNVAIHQNRDVNEGIKLTRQNDMLPILALIDSGFNKKDTLLNLIAKENNIDPKKVLDMELFLYDTTPGVVFGLNNEFINASKIDNLASTFAGLHGLLESKSETGINILACFDSEEIGSRTKQGADSNLLLNTMERISLSLNKDREAFFQMLYSSFLISVDGAHAIHPAKPEKMDITNIPTLNNGFVIKYSANQSYSTDGFSSSVIKNLANLNNIKYQETVNNSDERGGSTLGPISSSHIEINSVDLGIPMLGMHSVKETAGIKDIENLKELIRVFYSI
ncbi:MAG: M18 family aminopeptidase [Fusobacteriaceae bacterium]